MLVDVEVNNTTDSPVEEAFFARVAERTIAAAGCAFLQEKKISISVALVSEKEMQKLNRAHRRKDSVTDILSFFEYETREQLQKEDSPEIFLGELILCYDDIEKYAQAEKISLSQELINVTAHGVLHLLGFAHGEEMFSLQKKIISEMK